ncbi:MAG: tripartite tricarboxylate transporter substrate binding protein [Acetobacteraceae bacterium]|nr:tripartite tricarboxylate transporter substrate binding protein [Acetobacteraceae bacterium]
MRTRPGVPTPSERCVRAPRGKNGLTSHWLWLHLFGLWGLLSSRYNPNINAVCGLSGRAAIGVRMIVRCIFMMVLLACCAIGASASAQDTYPSKPVRLVVPFAVGGPSDIVARILSARMIESLGQQIIVDNRAGASGKIGSDSVAKAAPDGYTLVMATVSTHAINPGLFKSMPYDPLKDFEAIGKIGDIPLLLSVHKDVAAQDVKSLISLVRTNPNKLHFGSPGLGSMGHLCGEAFKAQSGGLDLAHVPYRGGGPMMNDLVSGQITMVFEGTPTSLPQIQAGTIRALASGATARTTGLPELPTMQEHGFVGFECSAWFGLLAPAKTPQVLIAKLTAALNAALADATVLARFRDLGVVASQDTSGAKLAAFMAADLAKWAPIIKAAGIQLD